MKRILAILLALPLIAHGQYLRTAVSTNAVSQLSPDRNNTVFVNDGTGLFLRYDSAASSGLFQPTNIAFTGWWVPAGMARTNQALLGSPLTAGNIPMLAAGASNLVNSPLSATNNVVNFTAVGPSIQINALPAGNGADLEFYSNGVFQALFGVAQATNNLVGGASAGDYVFRSNGKRFLLSLDNGAASQFVLAHNTNSTPYTSVVLVDQNPAFILNALPGSLNGNLQFQSNGVVQALWGVAEANDSLVVGSIPGQLVQRASGKMLFSVDNGFTSSVAISTNALAVGTSTPTSPLHIVGLPVFANNAAALAGGLTVGAFYRTGADPDPVCVVH